MLKVLGKVFSILEAVICGSGEGPLRIQELAERFSLPPATCARLLKELTDLGYLSKVSRSLGYTAGPRAAVFANMVCYNSRLTAAAGPRIERLSRVHSASVLFCVMQGSERFVLQHSCGSHELRIRMDQMSYHDLPGTATGLVLLACSGRRLREEALAGYPVCDSHLLPEGREFQDFLAEIRHAGEFIDREHHGSQVIMAFPVYENHVLAGALGASVEKEYFENKEAGEVLIQAVRNAAAEITKELSFSGKLF